MNQAVQKQEPVEEVPSDDEIERALFNQQIADDPDVPAEKPAVVPKTEPEAEPEPEPEPEPQAGAAPPAKEEPTGFEWLDDLAEEKRAQAVARLQAQEQENARLRQRVSSHLGQLQPAQRAIAQLQQKVRQLEALKPNEDASIGAIAKAQKELTFAEIDKEYKDFPEEAAKLKALFTESLDGVVRSIPAPPRQEPRAMVGPDPRSEVQHLATAYSDWGERRYSPEFTEWLGQQAQDTQQLLNSPYAADNIALLDAFTRDNPSWMPPQAAEEFHSLAQAQHSPLYRGWAQAEGINPDLNLAAVPDFQRDGILSRFKSDLGLVRQELEQAPAKPDKLQARRRTQLQDRDPGSRRVGVKPGQQIDLDTVEGQRAYYNQLIAADPDLRTR